MSRRMECSVDSAEIGVTRRTRTGLAGAAGLALMLALGAPLPANAQLDMLRNALGGSSGGGNSGGLAGSLGELGSAGSLASGSIGNATGVLQFCIKNSYLNGASLGSATDVKDKLLGKIGTQSGSPAASPGYLDGAKGLLSAPDGKTVDLNGGGLKEQIARQVCDKILDQAKSFL